MGQGKFESNPEWFAFADSVFKVGRPWIRETTCAGHTGTRTWVETSVTITQAGGLWVADATVPKG